MKKLTALTLVIVMLLSLCACSSGVDKKYADLIESLESHDYEAAMYEVMALRQQAIKNGDIVIVEPQDEDRELVYAYENIVRNLQNMQKNNYIGIHLPHQDQRIHL